VMTLDSFLTVTHAVLLLGIFGFVASYKPDCETRYRPAISIFAATLAGICLALVAQIVTNWEQSCSAPQPLWTLFTALVFVAVAYTRGNVAKLFPRVKWGHHQ
jgi:peptidoglycan/LPS O-acetylase OafA/YrhL